jgi:hypothetical protein
VNSQDREFPHGPTRLYYEAHITIDPVDDVDRAQANDIGTSYGFRLAKLLMDKGVPSQLDTFLTGRGKEYEDILARTRMVVDSLKRSGFVVRRAKIEDTLLDTNHGDLL